MEIRDLTSDDLDQAFDVRSRSFGPLPSSFGRDAWNRSQQRSLDDRRTLAVEDGGRIVATARINDFRQWWLGRAVRMAGIGGVVVLPEARGRGVGTALMSAIIERAAELGFPLSALYPATVPIYRSVGYEMAGTQRLVTIPAAALRTLVGRGPYVEIRRPVPGDESTITDLISGLHESHRDAGPIEYRPEEWLKEINNDQYIAYLAEDGFLGYSFEDDIETIQISHLVGGSEATLRTLWSVVGSGSSVTKSVHVAISPDDPIQWLLPERGLVAHRDYWWMLRLVDAQSAIAGRGFPTTVNIDVAVRLGDPQVAAHNGNWRITVSAGSGALVRDNTDPADALDLGPQGLAALYAGRPLHALRRAGLARGGTPEGDAALDAAFAARPYMLDYF